MDIACMRGWVSINGLVLTNTEYCRQTFTSRLVALLCSCILLHGLERRCLKRSSASSRSSSLL
jgi:hypothetical protein